MFDINFPGNGNCLEKIFLKIFQIHLDLVTKELKNKDSAYHIQKDYIIIHCI